MKRPMWSYDGDVTFLVGDVPKSNKKFKVNKCIAANIINIVEIKSNGIPSVSDHFQIIAHARWSGLA